MTAVFLGFRGPFAMTVVAAGDIDIIPYNIICICPRSIPRQHTLDTLNPFPPTCVPIDRLIILLIIRCLLRNGRNPMIIIYRPIAQLHRYAYRYSKKKSPRKIVLFKHTRNTFNANSFIGEIIFIRKFFNIFSIVHKFNELK